MLLIESFCIANSLYLINKQINDKKEILDAHTEKYKIVWKYIYNKRLHKIAFHLYIVLQCQLF
jgi:hypothetical protein